MTTKKTAAVRTLFPYMGGKGKIKDWVLISAPDQFRDYYEPFLGGGAIALSLLSREPKGSKRKFHLSDYNPEIVAAWTAVKDTPELLISILEGFFAEHSRDHFNAVRNWDRTDALAHKSVVERGARLIYLAKTTFGGALTTDKSGFMKASYAHRANTRLGHTAPDYENIRAVSRLLNEFDVSITQGSYEKVLDTVGFGDFIYLDPPYETSGDDGREITSNYVADAFCHRTLRENFDRMTARGGMVLMSNSDTAPIRELYAGFACVRPDHHWGVTSGATEASEILVSNWRLADRLAKQRALSLAA